MDGPSTFSKVLAAAARGAAVLALTAIPMMGMASAQGVPSPGQIFRVFPDDSGRIQSATALLSLDGHNKFFDPALGTNGQACVTCHQPDQGFTLSPENIQEAFVDSNGLDPLFRVNDTADRPDADPSAADTFKLFLDTGVIRIGKTLPAGADFTVEPQDTLRFGPLPNPNDPQAPGRQTLSLFRRPLVNTNVRFDSSVLWDGRANINNMRAQVKAAARGLLLAGDVSDADADDVASFMVNVFTDQVSDTDAGTIGAGNLAARGAKGGVANLLALASDPAAPCLFAVNGTPPPPLVLTVFTPPTCTPIIPENPHTVTIFDAWANLPDEDGLNAGRASVARGQAVFNTATLHVPADLEIPGLSGNVAHCITCHATNNIGNHPDPTFHVRIGTDSVDILSALAVGDSRINTLLDRVKELPEYCLRPTSDPTPFTTAACGTQPGDVKTTDPGRALVSGKIADVGKFKPPILRGLTARSPYFHAGVADGIDALVDFYDARFQIGLTDQEHDDLVAFLEVY
jgi:cytochrome c peroxidase